MSEIKLAALNIITFDQTAETNIKYEIVEQSIIFLQELRYSPIVLQAFSRIWFQQFSVPIKSIYQLNAESILSLTQQASPRDFIQEIWHPMILLQDVHVENTKGPNNAFNMAQQVTVELVKHNPKDNISFNHTVGLNADYTREIEQVLDLKHGVSVYKPSKIFIAG